MQIKILEDEVVCQGKRVSLLRRKVSLEGKEVDYDVVRFGESVVIIPVTEKQEVIMVRQWRPTFNAWVLELPAGKVEGDEDPRDAALRELIEETGYSAGKVDKLGTFIVSPGYSDERIHVYLAIDLEFLGASPEEDEVINIHKCGIKQCISELATQDLIDMKSLAALLFLKERLPYA